MNRGRPIQPKLLRYFLDNYKQLKIPTLDWAAQVKQRDRNLYEFIGEHDALMALGCVTAKMLDVGKSGKKSGPGFSTQKLANGRFRLELNTRNDLKFSPVNGAPLETAETIKTLPVKQDHMSLSLAKASALVRRYSSKLRPKLYEGMCNSAGNGWQLIESFPWLAVRVLVLEDDIATHARRIVRRGAKLREIAEAAKVPMCFKRFMPKATDRLMDLVDLLSRHINVVSHHCPEGERKQVSWLSAIAKAYESRDEDFAMWVAVHWSELSDEVEYVHRAHQTVADLTDWIGACVIEQSTNGIEAAHIEGICQAMLIADRTEAADNIREWWQSVAGAAEAGRPFNNKMSPQTVLRLSNEWHERAAETKAADVAFPEPWREGGAVGEYQIEPLRTAPELGRCAYHLHNCSATYAHRVAAGRCFLYVVSQADTPKAMVQLSLVNQDITLDQISGPRNDEVPGELEAAVKTWFDGPKLRPLTAGGVS